MVERVFDVKHPMGWQSVFFCGCLSLAVLICGGLAGSGAQGGQSIAMGRLAGLSGEPQDAVVDAYHVGQLWVGDGSLIRDAILVTADGKIVSVGPRAEVTVPAGARLHRLEDQVMMPGLVIAETSLAEGGRDDEYAVSPQVQAVDGFDFFEPRADLLAAGITTVQLSPGSARLMPGQGSVIKLAGDSLEQRVLSRSESVRILLTQAAFSPPTIYEPPVGAVSEVRPLLPTQPQLAGTLSGAVAGLRALMDAANELSPDGGEAVEELPVRALSDAWKSGATFRITARTDAELRAAIEWCEAYELKRLMVRPSTSQALAAADWSDSAWRGVVLSPGVRPGRLGGRWGWTDDNDDSAAKVESAWEIAAALVAAGAQEKLAIAVESDQDLVHVRYLAALFQRAGLSEGDVLRMLTDNPARMMGVADRVGRLAVGMDADFVVLSGSPLANSTRVEATYISGAEVYLAPVSEDTTVIAAAQVYSNGQWVDGGKVAVRGGKVVGVGATVSAPMDARLEKFAGAYVVPGFLDLGTSVGWGAPVSDRLGLQTKLGDFLAVDDQEVAAARRGGITTGLLSSTSLPSPVVAFKMLDRPRVLRDPVAVRFEVKGNLTQTESTVRRTLQGAKDYHESWNRYEAARSEYEQQLKSYEAAKAKWDAEQKAKAEAAASEKENSEKESGETVNGGDSSAQRESTGPQTPGAKPAQDKPAQDKPAQDKPAQDKPAQDKPDGAAVASSEPVAPKEPEKPKLQEALEPYRLLFRAEIPAIVETSDALATRLALRLFRSDFGLETILVVSEQGEQVYQEIADAGAKSIVGPELMREVDGRWMNAPQQLAAVGVPFGFQSKAAGASAGLPYLVGFSVNQGLADHDALGALSSIAADLFGLSGVGTLVQGSDADLVVWSGQPFEPGSEVVAVMIDGQWVYRRAETP
jgi:imidazolonepropionase-like amidohydrolase